MKEANPNIDMNYTRFCIEGNLRNALTAHYNLLIKKKTLMQESLSDLENYHE